MKRAYMTPAMRVVEIQQHGIICTSDWNVMGPGQTNQPAGTREWDEWEERSDNF